MDKLLSSHNSKRNQKVDEISFIIPGQPVEKFGRTFETFEDCLKYCDENDIPYTKEQGCFGWDAYDFPTA